MNSNTSASAKPTRYVHAIGANLRALLYFIFALVALLGATGIYLIAIRLMGYYTQFALWMLLVHIVLGVVLVFPFLLFGVTHLLTARNRPNRRAVKLGMVLFVVSIVIGVTGLALIQLDGMPQLRDGALMRNIVLYLHILAPLLSLYIYIQHRRAGPRIKWKWGIGWGASVAVFTIIMASMHSHDPRSWHQKGSTEGERYFEPSKARTANGKFISAKVMMMDEYCMKCHEDIYKDHLHSAHKFSSFNNPAYLFSVMETRERMGIRASRWCAGCHDPVPFFSGQFDDPKYDVKNHPTAHAGITCTVCHAMTHVNSRSGNADYTIEEPVHYPFAYSDKPMLQWVNNQLVKAKPDFHKRTFLKPFHKSEKFCTTCHKVGIPQEVNHYKEFLRGQNHGDSFLLSGVSGHGVRSWYYPRVAKRCNECHMPLKESQDRGARDFDGSGKSKVHSHFFFGANTGVHPLIPKKRYPELYNPKLPLERHREFLRGGIDGNSPTMRIDIFGLKLLKGPNDPKVKHGTAAELIDDQPLRPKLPMLKPGATYMIETVIRTLNMGHHFTQGTADSNEVWVEFIAKAGDRIIGHSGLMDQGKDKGSVDPGSHFLNVLMLDRFGNRIDRRNAQDIFTPFYNHQIPPGAANVVHYKMAIPSDLTPGHPVKLAARVRYRKFDYTYMAKIFDNGKVPQLPIIDLCEDEVTLPVAGIAENVPRRKSPIKKKWQRWNDYGIGCFLEGGPDGKTTQGELAQAEKCFARILQPEFGEWPEAEGHGHLNLARVYLASPANGGYKKAEDALRKAMEVKPPAPWWTVAWFTSQLNKEKYGNFDKAIQNLQTIIDPKNAETARKFDFGKDFVLLNELGALYFERSKTKTGKAKEQDLRTAIAQYEKTLKLDPENSIAHDQLRQIMTHLTKYPQGEWQPELIVALRVNGRRAFSKSLLALQKAAWPLPMINRELSKQAGTTAPVSTVAALHAGCWTVAAESRDPWLRLGLGSTLGKLDKHMLDGLVGNGGILTDKSRSLEKRKQAAVDILMAFKALSNRPPAAQSLPLQYHLKSGVLPIAGLPFERAMTALTSRGYVREPLLAPRILTLEKLHRLIRPMFESERNAALRAAATDVLANIHLQLHLIYKPDPNAAAKAVRIYRTRNPIAEPASHSITIYELSAAEPR